MPSKLKKAIGAVKDQTSISLAKVASKTELEVAILKATTHDNVPIDERYVYEVVELVSSNKIYAASCARAIGKRIGRTRNWIVALKSLMLVLRIFQDGDPYFPREVLHAMKRGDKILNLSNFRDDSNSGPWDYTAFVRMFALYLDERLDCFLTGKLQRRYTIKDSESRRKANRRHNEMVSDMKPAMLLDRITFWQRLLDKTISTRPTGVARTNRLVLLSLYAIVQESFDLYKDISDGLTLLLDGFFHLPYNSCVSAFQACGKASIQYKELAEYYFFCQSIGVGRESEYPSVQTISQELIDTLQEFLKDQSSFPAVAKSPQRLALPAPPNSSRHDYGSYGEQPNLSEFSTSRYSSRRSEGISEFGSQCTLEDLMSAMDKGMRQGISIDLETYNTDQFDNHSPRNETLRTSDAGSTHSLPALNAMGDLLSLDDWPEQVQETASEQQQSESNSATGWELVLAETLQHPSTTSESNASSIFNAFQEQEQRSTKTSFRDNWELVLADTKSESINVSLDDLYNQSLTLSPEISASTQNMTSLLLEPTQSNTFDPFLESENEKQKDMSLREGRELVLADTATQPPQQQPDISSSFDSLYNQRATSSAKSYNPFLIESSESAIVPSAADPNTTNTSIGDSGTGLLANDAFSTAPTFQAIPAAYTSPTFLATTPIEAAPTFVSTNPTFSAKDANDMTLHNENDPFSELASEHMFNSSINQQSLLHEQQLWLQQQNEIIAKHMA